MNLVYEDEYGAYQGVRPDFLKKFVPREINPNFEVYDSKDRQNRFIVSKCSRLPHDEDLAAGRFGIDFYRAKPTLQQALEYGAVLPRGYQWLGDIAFAAQTKEEYAKKTAVWDSYNSFVWGESALTIWVAPHAGSVNRPPDDILPNPKLWIDTGTAGVAARCALNANNRVSKRNVVFVHATGILGAVLNLGDLGILDETKLNLAAEKVERKHHKKVQVLADDFKNEFVSMTLRIIKHAQNKRGTLDPTKLESLSHDDAFTLSQIRNGLKIYGQDIKGFSLEEFEKALSNLGKIDVLVTSCNSLFAGRKSGLRLHLAEKIEKGLLNSAFQVECARQYIRRAPELVADILLDVKTELFG